MCQNVVIPARCAPPASGSRPFNSSCKAYLNLESRFTVCPAERPGMMRKGFTLIELLVVVLIVGILSSVALPQYQKAVKKTRLMRLAPLIKAMANAEEAYYLANGQYTPFSSELDISWPSGTLKGSVSDDGFLLLADGTTLDLLGYASYLTDGVNAYVLATTKEGLSYYQYLDHSAYPGKRICKGDTSLCKSFGGESLAGGWTIP